MNKIYKKLNYYRKILLLIPLFYAVYFLLYFIADAADPMSLWNRIFSISLFLAVCFLSFKMELIKENVDKFTYFLSLYSVLQLLYYNYKLDFALELALTMIAAVALFNLIFKADERNLITNFFLVLILTSALIFKEKSFEFIIFYFSSYFIIAALSYFVKYNMQNNNDNLKESLEEQKIILNTIDTQLWYLKEPLVYGRANEAHAEFLGIPKEKIENRRVSTFFDEQETEICRMGNKEVFDQKRKIKTEEWTKNSNNEKRLLSIVKNPRLNNEGEVDYVVCSAQDITERRKQQEELEIQHQFQKTLAEISSQLLTVNSGNIDRILNNSLGKIAEFFEVERSYIFKFSDDGKTMTNTHEWSAAGVEAQKERLKQLSTAKFNWWLKELKNKSIIKIEDLDKLPAAAEGEKELLAAQKVKSLLVLAIFIENELFGFFGFDTVQKEKNFSNQEINMLQIFTDVITSAFARYLDEKRIRKLTYYDSLTGLYNRRFFEEEMQRLDTKRQLPISLIMADLNGLKIINDSYGHEKGDQLLKKAAAILKSSVREEDILARQGGDEFAILLPKTEQKKAKQVIKRIKSKIAAAETEIPISIALGWATKNESEEQLTETLKKADDRMYQNKLSESRSSKSKIVQGLLNTLAAKSSETKEHAVRMTKLAFEFGEKLKLSNSELNRLSLLATLHDIGKTNISEKILNKPDKLTNNEWEIMKNHSEQGYKIASASEEFALVADEIYAHHEHWDGSGYPRELAGEDIPYLARIISIIDAYDVMTSNRPYSQAVSEKEALAEINECAGTQFDPELAEEFIKLRQN
jgi:diguanylate cyclase (GGDEF)-like protein/PAS domain S-box-containing protein